ncbi:hypothetical protein [Streptomyces sp. NPDC090114]|uniref:Gfo/Idh/MocA family oxidoreductase n=1 Tax=Streptomyces edwardsiae TaxID=3075527 RepID=A0ABU2PU58_9ACTN|nr:hypothetical protein [Streptomyces sp. DSM 41636]
MTAAVRAGFIGGGFMAEVHTRASGAAGARLVAPAQPEDTVREDGAGCEK